MRAAKWKESQSGGSISRVIAEDSARKDIEELATKIYFRFGVTVQESVQPIIEIKPGELVAIGGLRAKTSTISNQENITPIRDRIFPPFSFCPATGTCFLRSPSQENYKSFFYFLLVIL